jgi:DnaK suppressor protein
VVAAAGATSYNTRPLRLKESKGPDIVAAKTKPAKKPAPKPAKKPAKPVAKAKAPVAKAKAPAKPAAKAKPVAKPAAKGKTVAKPAAKSRPVAKPAAKAKPIAKPLPKPAAKPAAPAKPAAKPAPVKTIAPAPAPVAKAPAKSAPAKSAPVRKDATPTAGNAMTPKNAAQPVPAVAKAPVAVRDTGVRAKAVKPNRPLGNGEPPQPLSALPERVDLPPGYKPKSGEEYMSAQQLEYFRQKLMNWRADLVEESKQTIDNLREEVRDVGDDAERATRETENSLELRTRDRYRKLISKIDKALKRIDDGAYGYCEETGEEIGIERLEARPIATLCLDAQERWEHRQRLMGD